MDREIIIPDMQTLAREQAAAIADLDKSFHDLAKTVLRVKAQRDGLLAGVKQLFANARFADGQGIVLTQDCESLEAVIAKIESGAK